ncbi:hypothetical protein SAMN04488122_2123 [Chitinophaga arvensicola]|uniref:Uncharacterized protein n=1 Tax=Chitinophaga arvensicola TaxID=29529 RepID=A0A1I0R2A8_9BACT|nr:hypothetical protein SAMN04488122_2123 [Chitinophaga arvensicola]
MRISLIGSPGDFSIVPSFDLMNLKNQPAGNYIFIYI